MKQTQPDFLLEKARALEVGGRAQTRSGRSGQYNCFTFKLAPPRGTGDDYQKIAHYSHAS